jgi:fatty acid/phospholipid biosynthesis enzyme
MKIGIDVLGGDFAPDVNIDGASLALNELPQDVTLVLLGSCARRDHYARPSNQGNSSKTK